MGRPLRSEDPVFHVSTKVVELVEKDAVWAGLGRFDKTSFTDKKRHRYRYVDNGGRDHRLDFHAVSRVTLRTMLDRMKPAPSERLTNMIMRHRPTGVGQISYSQTNIEDMYEVVCRMPVPGGVGGVLAHVLARKSPGGASHGTVWHTQEGKPEGLAHGN